MMITMDMEDMYLAFKRKTKRDISKVKFFDEVIEYAEYVNEFLRS